MPGFRGVEPGTRPLARGSVGGARMRTGLVALVATVALVNAAPSRASDGTLQRYARDTWASFAAMTDPASGLPADVLDADGTTSVQTSTTNIGAYMWSALVAERLGIIRHG